MLDRDTPDHYGSEQSADHFAENATGTGRPRRVVSLRAKLIYLFLFATVSGAAWTVYRTYKDDLSYLPDESDVLAQIQFQDFRRSELGQHVVKLTEDQATDVPTEIFNNLERLSLGIVLPKAFVKNAKLEWSAVARLSGEVDLAEMLRDQHTSDVQEVVAGYRKLVVASPYLAYCQVDSRTFVCGSENAVRSVFDRLGRRARLNSMLKQEWGNLADDHSQLAAIAFVPAFFQDRRMPPALADAEPKILKATANADNSVQLKLSLMAKDTGAAEQLLSMLKPYAALMSTSSNAVKEFELSNDGPEVLARMGIDGAELVSVLQQRVKITRKSGADDQCSKSAAILNEAVERYFFDLGKWPTSPSDVDEYFKDEVIPTHCPIHGTPFEFDERFRVSSHSH